MEHHLKTRFSALFNSGAWLLIVIGLALFASRLPFATEGWFNLPLVASILQVAGFMFTIMGLQVVASIIMFPQLNVSALLETALSPSSGSERAAAASRIMFALLIFNGLSLIAFVLWITSSVSGAVAGG